MFLSFTSSKKPIRPPTMCLCCCFFKVCPPLLPLACLSLVGGPFPHPCVIRESMSSAPQSRSAFIRKHDSWSFEVDRSGNICVQQAGSFMCCQHFICDSNEGQEENKLSILLSAATADVYEFLSVASTCSYHEGIWKCRGVPLLGVTKS